MCKWWVDEPRELKGEKYKKQKKIASSIENKEEHTHTTVFSMYIYIYQLYKNERETFNMPFSFYIEVCNPWLEQGGELVYIRYGQYLREDEEVGFFFHFFFACTVHNNSDTILLFPRHTSAID